jgi:hypothetical protein
LYIHPKVYPTSPVRPRVMEHRRERLRLELGSQSLHSTRVDDAFDMVSPWVDVEYTSSELVRRQPPRLECYRMLLGLGLPLVVAGLKHNRSAAIEIGPAGVGLRF